MLSRDVGSTSISPSRCVYIHANAVCCTYTYTYGRNKCTRRRGRRGNYHKCPWDLRARLPGRRERERGTKLREDYAETSFITRPGSLSAVVRLFGLSVSVWLRVCVCVCVCVREEGDCDFVERGWSCLDDTGSRVLR